MISPVKTLIIGYRNQGGTMMKAAGLSALPSAPRPEKMIYEYTHF
jgi:hypothetical protein